MCPKCSTATAGMRASGGGGGGGGGRGEVGVRKAISAGVVTSTGDDEAKAAPLIAFLRGAIEDPDVNVKPYALALAAEGVTNVKALQELNDADLVRACMRGYV